jgi:hypothetical protein
VAWAQYYQTAASLVNQGIQRILVYGQKKKKSFEDSGVMVQRITNIKKGLSCGANYPKKLEK